MKVERESFVRFAVAVALACYDLPADRAMTSDEAARLVNGKMPLIISVAGVQQHLFWFYPQQPFEEMCETLSAMLKEIPVTCDSVPA